MVQGQPSLVGEAALDEAYPHHHGGWKKGDALKSLDTKVEFFRHNLEKEDIEKVREVLESLFLTTGAVTAEFEQKFAQRTGLPHVVGLTSCTAAFAS